MENILVGVKSQLKMYKLDHVGFGVHGQMIIIVIQIAEKSLLDERSCATVSEMLVNFRTLLFG